MEPVSAGMPCANQGNRCAMRNQPEKPGIQPPRLRLCAPFTLVEMLVVLVIMIIIIAVSLPAMKSFTIGSGVEAAARMGLLCIPGGGLSSRARVAAIETSAATIVTPAEGPSLGVDPSGT